MSYIVYRLEIRSYKCRYWYIGSTVDLERRKNQHMGKLKKRKHSNKLLQKGFDKRTSENCFRWVILKKYSEIESRDWLYMQEQESIIKFRKRAKSKSRQKNKTYIFTNKANPHHQYALARIIQSSKGEKKKKKEAEYFSKYSLSQTKKYSKPMRGSEVRERIKQIKG